MAASDVSISVLQNKLYDACLQIQEDDPQHVFHQNELQEFENIPPIKDLQTLLLVVQKLLDEKLFKMVHDTDGMGWKLRTREEAKKCVTTFPSNCCSYLRDLT